MKLLLDSCMSGRRVPLLRTAGHDVEWAGDWPADPGDRLVLARANDEGRILVTLDKDFGALAVVRGQKHAGIIRLVGIPGRDHVHVILQALNVHGAALDAGALVVIEPKRTRIRLDRD